MTTAPERGELTLRQKDPTSDREFQKHLKSLTKEEREEIDLKDPERVAEEYDLFNKTQEVRKGLERMWPAHIEEALGIKLGKEGREAVAAHLRKEMRENPEEIEVLAEKLDAFRANREEIRSLEATLEAQRAEHGAAIATARREGDAAAYSNRKIERTRSTWKIWERLSKRHAGNIKAAEAANQARLEAEREAAALAEDMRRTEGRVGELHGEHAAGRDEVVAGLLKEERLAKLVREKVEERMNKALRNGRGFKDVEKMGALGKKYRDLAENAEAEDVMDSEGLDEKLDELVDERAKAEVQKAFEKIRVGSRFEKLEEQLSAFVNANPLGSREREEAREFVTTMLEEHEEQLESQVEALTDESTDKEKDAIIRLAMMGSLRERISRQFDREEEDEAV